MAGVVPALRVRSAGHAVVGALLHRGDGRVGGDLRKARRADLLGDGLGLAQPGFGLREARRTRECLP